MSRLSDLRATLAVILFAIFIGKVVAILIRFGPMNKDAPDHIIGHLDWPTRFRFATAIAISIIVFTTIGRSVLEPRDPEGAIRLILVDSSWYLWIRAGAIMVAVAVLSTVIMDGRLVQFGTLVACIGLACPVVMTGGMDYLMVRYEEGKEFSVRSGVLESLTSLWGHLALEMLAWTITLGVVVAASAVAERWLARNGRAGDPADPPVPKPSPKENIRSFRGPLGTAITAVVAAVLISLLCASREKGQVIFAVAAGFFVASLVSDQLLENRHPVWSLAAVPILSVAAYLYTAFHQDRPAGFEAILHLAPNHLAAVLPIEYLCAGSAAAIFGLWTSERIRFSSLHE